jgi:2-haloacid dehalogenase
VESSDRVTTPDPALVSSDVFGTLLDVRAGTYASFERILARANAADLDVKAFWEAWEHANIRRYREPYRSYKAICTDSLAETLSAHGLDAARAPALIGEYFAAFADMPLYPDVAATFARLAKRRALAVVSNIDDDLFAATRVAKEFDFAIAATAERARGYKPDGALFRYLIAEAAKRGIARDAILHMGQSQFTDMVGAKPLGLQVAWINRRGIALSSEVPKPDWIFPDIASVATLIGD